MSKINVIDCIVLILIIIGALNWGLIGLFDYDLVSGLFGFGNWFSRTIFAIVGFAGLYGIFYLCRRLEGHQ